MKKWDERARVKYAVLNWIANYGVDGSYKADTRCRRVGKELQTLDVETATAAQVSEIIGDSSWAGPVKCGQCGDATYDIVEVGEPDDYDSHTVYICKACLRSALDLLR